MARTNRDYWMACIRACVGLLVITVAFEVGAMSLLRSSASDKTGDLRSVLGLWGTLAVALPFLLFVFSRARDKAEGSTASPATKVFAVLVTAGFSLGLTGVAWGSLFLLRVKQDFDKPDWPPEFRRNFVDSCAAKASRPVCVCFADRLQHEGSALDATTFMARLQAGDPAAKSRMNALRAQCLGASVGRPR